MKISSRTVDGVIVLITGGALLGLGAMLGALVSGTGEPAQPAPAPVSSPSPSPSLTREDWLADPYVRCIEAMGNAELPAELCAPMDDPR